MMRLVLLVFLFWFYFVGRWIDGLDLVHGFCRDAGMLLLPCFAHRLLTVVAGLWNTQLGIKPNKLFKHSAIRA